HALCMLFPYSTLFRSMNFGDKFWYEYNSPSGKKWYLVDPKTKKKSELFDHADMASRITSIVKNPFDAQHLEIRNLRFMDNENLRSEEHTSELQSRENL